MWRKLCKADEFILYLLNIDLTPNKMGIFFLKKNMRFTLTNAWEIHILTQIAP